jgi:hypothetical protein
MQFNKNNVEIVDQAATHSNEAEGGSQEGVIFMKKRSKTKMLTHET